MRWSYVLLLPFLGGCLAPATLPDSDAGYDVNSKFLGQNTGGKASPGDQIRPPSDPAPNSSRAMPLSLLDEQILMPLSQLEETAAELPDPETLEDNRILSGAGESPPENEGQTVAAEEVVFDFPVVENEKVNYYIDYFTGRARSTFTRWLERSGRYLPMMREIFLEEGLPEDLTYLSMVESGFNDRAYSWAHAVGLWQFIGSTGRMYGLEGDWWHDERRDFEKSTRAAARFLKHLHARFDGDWYLAIASYNCGPGRIENAIRKFKTRDFWELSRHKYLPTETKNYVPKMLAALLISKQPEKYGFTNLKYQQPLIYDVVEVPTTTDLEIVASLCEVDYEDVKALNPELKRWCTPPDKKQYRLRIPAGKKDLFDERYSLLPEDERANYARHRIKRGDTLLALANRYGIRVEDIVSLNSIRNPRSLQIGTELILPLKKGLTVLPAEASGDDYIRTRRQNYTVRKGDTLWDISRRFGVSEKELRVWNRLGWSNTIRPGQKLIVSSSAGGRSQKNPVKIAGARITYTVQPGDNLWDISRRYRVTTAQLRSWNGLSETHILRPGDSLKIEGTASAERRKIVYKVQPGDTLWDIGRRYDIATREIMDTNNLSDGSVLRPGDQLTLMIGDGRRG